MSHAVKALEEKIDVLENQIWDLQHKRDVKLVREMNIMFSFLPKDVTLKVSAGSGIEFHRFITSSGYNREIFKINLYEDYRTNKVKEVGISFYSSSDASKESLERLVIVGQISDYLLQTEGKKLQEIWNKIGKEYSDKSTPIYTEKYKLEKEKKEIEQAIKEKEQNAYIAKVKTDGVQFDLDGENKRNFPSLETKYNESISWVKSLKILRESGKSVDIEITRLYNKWNGEDYDLVELDKEVIKRVKLENVMYFLRSSKEYVK